MTTQYRFAILDPRPISAAAEANDRVFDEGPVLGIEVTVPALAARCELGNLDPQHAGGDATRAAIDDALTAELPADGSTLATVRPDLDAVGAMAILHLRKRGYGVYGDLLDRAAIIAAADKFAHGGWAPRPLPTRENPWPTTQVAASDSGSLAAIAAAMADFKVPIADRVAMMERWLLTGDEPGEYRSIVERERADLIAALESGAIKVETTTHGKIAVVESTHRAATSVGYSMAPVVVALNPTFQFQGGAPHRKFTVCAFEAQHADIRSALAELATLEAGWGGSPTIGGSPQGVSSALTTDQVVEVVTRHLR